MKKRQGKIVDGKYSVKIDAEWIEYPANHLQTCTIAFQDMELLTWLRLYNEKEEAP